MKKITIIQVMVSVCLLASFVVVIVTSVCKGCTVLREIATGIFCSLLVTVIIEYCNDIRHKKEKTEQANYIFRTIQSDIKFLIEQELYALFNYREHNENIKELKVSKNESLANGIQKTIDTYNIIISSISSDTSEVDSKEIEARDYLNNETKPCYEKLLSTINKVIQDKTFLTCNNILQEDAFNFLEIGRQYLKHIVLPNNKLTNIIVKKIQLLNLLQKEEKLKIDTNTTLIMYDIEE